MTTLDNIVNLTITRETAAISQAGFGSAAFLSNNAVFQERIKVYSSFTAVQEDALAGADTLASAAKYFGQEIRPTQLYVIKKGRDLPRVQTFSLDSDFVTGNQIDLNINDVAISTVNFATDHDTTLAALASAMQASADVVSATVTGPREITVTGDDDDVAVVIDTVVIAGGASQPTETITVTQYEDGVLTNLASIAAAQLINNDWYGFAAYTRVASEIEEIAAVIEAQRKLYGYASNDADILTSGSSDIASTLQAAAYDRTFGIYSDDEANYPEMALFGRVLPTTPGSVTWAFKTLAGITYDDLNDTEKTNAEGKGINLYLRLLGNNFTWEGFVASGEYIDVIRGIDWMYARIQENVFGAFLNNDKIPFTDDGAATIENQVIQVLQQAEDNTLLSDDPKFTTSVPLAANVSTVDKAARRLPDVTFDGTLAGAIHKTVIAGRVSV